MRRWISTVLAIVVTLSGLVFSAAPAQAAVDVYTTPGYHDVNGRKWHTTCSNYSPTITRGRTEIRATRITYTNGKFVSTTTWFFNNLTYVAAPRAAWIGNNLGKHAYWTDNGRRWKTECDSAVTGYNACRSYIWSNYVEARKTASGSYTYVLATGWVFNSMVRFSTDYYVKYSGSRHNSVPLPKGLTEGLISYTISGGAMYGIETATPSNQWVDGIASGFGTVQATGVFGSPSDGATQIRINTDADWTMVLKPLTVGPTFSGSYSGTESVVLSYTGPAVTKSFRHPGPGLFTVQEMTLDAERRWEVLANGGDAYSGKKTLLAGPALLIITSEGPWSIS